MRSIGKRNIKLVKEVVKKVYPTIDKQQFGWIDKLHSKVEELIPDSIFDTWEMADQEVENIIDDYIQEMIQEMEER